MKDKRRATDIFRLVTNGVTFKTAGKLYNISSSRTAQLYWWLLHLMRCSEYKAVNVRAAGIEFVRLNKLYFLDRLSEFEQGLVCGD